MSGPDIDQLHRSTLGVYVNLMEQFNPGLQKLVSLGNSYIQAFQALATSSEAYFCALAKMGEQALHSMSSRSLGDVLIQISESQRRLTAELEGVFRWFHNEVLREMDNNVRLDKDYILSSRRRYEVEVRNQATALERQLRRGAYRDLQDGSDYVQFLRQSQRDALKEEERRYRFLAEKHCGLTQSILYLMNKTGGSLQQKAEGWRERVNETRAPRPRTPTHLDQDSMMGMREEERDQRWANKEELLMGRVPSRAPSPQVSRSRSSSLGETLGLGSARPMRALVSYPPSSNQTLLPFSRGETVTVLVKEPRNGWLYGRAESSLRQGWFPAAYVGPIEDMYKPMESRTPTLRSSNSMSNLLDEPDGYRQNGRPPPPAPPLPMPGWRPITPTPEKRVEPPMENKRPVQEEHRPSLFPKGTNPFATVKLRPTTTNDRSAPRI